jgi:hypothetical protein
LFFVETAWARSVNATGPFNFAVWQAKFLTLNERKSYETHSSLSKPVALSQELQTGSHHANPANRESDDRFPPVAPIWIEAGTRHRPIAQNWRLAEP